MLRRKFTVVPSLGLLSIKQLPPMFSRRRFILTKPLPLVRMPLTWKPQPSLATPLVEVMIDGFPRGKSLREQSPRATGLGDVKSGVADGTQRGARSATLFCGGQEDFQELPLGVSEVGFVGGAFHRSNGAAAKISRTAAGPMSSHPRNLTQLSSPAVAPIKNSNHNKLISQTGSKGSNCFLQP